MSSNSFGQNKIGHDMSCRNGCSLWSRGSWLGGSLVSALSFVASCTRWIGPCCSFRVPLFLFSVWGHSYHGTKLSSCMIWDDTKLSPLALIHLFHPQLVAVTSLLGVRFGFGFVCFCFCLFFVWGGFCLCRKSAVHRSAVRSNASSKIPTELRRRTRTSTTHTKHKRRA